MKTIISLICFCLIVNIGFCNEIKVEYLGYKELKHNGNWYAYFRITDNDSQWTQGCQIENKDKITSAQIEEAKIKLKAIVKQQKQEILGREKPENKLKIAIQDLEVIKDRLPLQIKTKIDELKKEAEK